jgi:hypothetical protein
MYTITLAYRSTTTTPSNYVAYDDVRLIAADPALTNGNFENGESYPAWDDLVYAIDWGLAVVERPGRTDNYSVRLGYGSRYGSTYGRSGLAQTFTVPAATPLLSFWYESDCDSNVTYDWARASVIDHTTGATTTVLPNTCTVGQGWKRVSAVLVGGHTYTLIFENKTEMLTAPTVRFDDIELLAASPLTNGSFEAGATGWALQGGASITTGDVHSGSRAAALQASGPSTATVQQRFVATGTAVSLWHKITCRDGLAKQWAAATLTDDATGATTNLLPRTCTKGKGWQQARASVVAGRSYTLRIETTSTAAARHAMSAIFDDVTVN